MRIILPYAIPSLNLLNRVKNRRSHKARDNLAWEVAAAIGYRPAEPLTKAFVAVFRYSHGELDHDNLIGACKPLLDVLQPMSKRHPAGLGIILNDDPDHCTLKARNVLIKANEKPRTIVDILVDPRRA